MKNLQPPTSNSEKPMVMRSGQRSLLAVGCWLLEVPKFLLVFAIRAYRWTISPAQLFLFGSTGGCRFTPTCSQYAMEAVQTYGAVAGAALAARRICRCHPWGDCGHDPVPEFGIRNSEFGISPKHTR